jgi:hypothetical protein
VSPNDYNFSIQMYVFGNGKPGVPIVISAQLISEMVVHLPCTGTDKHLKATAHNFLPFQVQYMASSLCHEACDPYVLFWACDIYC